MEVTTQIGTLAPPILMGELIPYALVFTTGILCSIFDITYIGLLLNYQSHAARHFYDKINL